MRIIIVGKSASGKDYFKKLLEDRGAVLDVSMTTRPKRDGEKNGVDYFFVDDAEFTENVRLGNMLQWQEFKGYKYGTHFRQWKDAEVFIMNVSGLAQLSENERAKAVVYYMNVSGVERFPRMLARDYNMTLAEYNTLVDKRDKKALEIEKAIHERINADEKEYANFDDYDVEVRNPNFLNPKHLPDNE